MSTVVSTNLSNLAGVVRDGTTLTLADAVCEALSRAGVEGVVVWTSADPVTRLAHGARWAQFAGGQWYCLPDALWDFLAGSGPLPEDLTELGPAFGDEVGDVVPGTRYSYFAS